jgi:hypothetical protein
LNKENSILRRKRKETVQIIRKGVITHSQLKKEMAKDFNSKEYYLKKHKFDVLTLLVMSRIMPNFQKLASQPPPIFTQRALQEVKKTSSLRIYQGE